MRHLSLIVQVQPKLTLYSVQNTNYLHQQNKSCGGNSISFCFVRLIINYLSVIVCSTRTLDHIIYSTLHNYLLFICLKPRLILKALFITGSYPSQSSFLFLFSFLCLKLKLILKVFSNYQ